MDTQNRSWDMNCPGCKEPYKLPEFDDESSFSSIPPAPVHWTASRAMSALQSSGKATNFDHSQWLFETQATYGYGSAFWSKEDAHVNGGGGEGTGDVSDKEWKPLARRIPISAAIISPYRLLILVRLVALAFFLTWRVRNKNHDAVWLWGMSVVCEIWFAFSWILDQLPKLCPVNRSTDLAALRNQFEPDLPGVDVFVSTADPEKEPPLVTAATILSILAADYPVDRIACYLSDDGGSLLTFETMAEAASFAAIWVPFCRKHDIEPRNPESYFALRRDPTKNKRRPDFVRDRRRVKREFDEFKVRVNGLPDAIRRRSDAFNAREEMKLLRRMKEAAAAGEEHAVPVPVRVQKATWMADGTHWPGTWAVPAPEHSKGDHVSILQVMLEPAPAEVMCGMPEAELGIDLTEVDVRLPMLVYVSREKRPGYDHNKKAGAMNALVRASAVMSNGPFILNLDCDHYIYNTQAIREGMCFLIDHGGQDICFIQFPQRFEGIDPNDRYANNNTVFFDGNMRALDGLQGPMYVGTGCIFRRFAVYGFDPPPKLPLHHPHEAVAAESDSETQSLNSKSPYADELNPSLLPKRFGDSSALLESIPVAEFQGRTLTFRLSAGSFRLPHPRITPSSIAQAVAVVSCWYEDRTEWGGRVGWIYGSVTEDVVTGYRMHNRGWRSVYCVTAGRDAFRGSAPINLTDRLHQVLRWATGSVEIFFSRNNALLASPRLGFLQRVAYLNVGIYPFTSVFLLVYCFLPALSLFTGHFIVETLSVSFLVYLLVISITLTLLAILEVRWSGVGLEEWWRNEQFWLISGTSAHLAAVMQGMLKVVAGIEISFTLTAKSAVDEENDDFADLYIVKWTSLMIPPITIMMVNIIAIAVGCARTIYSSQPEWSKLVGGGFFSFWVLAHLYPFAKG
ncbi:Cellulose synthase-like protein D4 [Platanthera guangdongensis]|uniref:Cellulose synthase-like protein D4 n=1 Tax=Platanthera guangdongensis TaxID=2320717 RepID=A0ABR2MLI1_9ASPA